MKALSFECFYLILYKEIKIIFTITEKFFLSYSMYRKYDRMKIVFYEELKITKDGGTRCRLHTRNY